MSFNECMDVIISLSHSQGFYGRLFRDIMELPENYKEELAKEWESHNFGTTVDFINYIEG